MKKKIMKRYRERVLNRESVCITLSLIPKIIKHNDNWRIFYEGWTNDELKQLYNLLYMSGGYRWIEGDKDLLI